jgi:ribulose-phosphate 3-epimerase
VKIQIAPSILSADFAALGQAVATVERAGADLIHLDVMDGHFVPNLSIGVPVVRSLKRVARVPLDVHLMISDPDRYLEAFADAGASYLSVHAEVLPHLHRTVHAIQALGVKAGVALNPSTPASVLEYVAADLDFVLVMSVNPGFGGQSFIASSERKVREVRALLDRVANSAPIEIDGGIDPGTAPGVVAAGARILVAGAAIFHSPDPERATRELKSVAERALEAASPAAR